MPVQKGRAGLFAQAFAHCLGEALCLSLMVAFFPSVVEKKDLHSSPFPITPLLNAHHGQTYKFEGVKNQPDCYIEKLKILHRMRLYLMGAAWGADALNYTRAKHD